MPAREGWTSPDWLRSGYAVVTDKRNQSNDWLRLGEGTTLAVAMTAGAVEAQSPVSRAGAGGGVGVPAG